MVRIPASTHVQAGKVFYLSDHGYSQRRIAADVGLSQSTVQRILSAPRPVAPVDADGIFAEYDELYEAAMAAWSLAAFRHLHRVALACHANGYNVHLHSLPLLVLLSHALNDATSASERAALRSEIEQVYADRRAWDRANGRR